MPGVPGVEDITQIRKEFSSLQAQVERLSDQVNKTSATAARAANNAAAAAADDDDGVDRADLTYLSHRKGDEVSRFVRGIVFASLEAMGAAADSVSRLTTETTERNVPKRNETVGDVARRLPGDISHGVVSGLDDALDIPSRAIRRFSDIYRDPSERGRSTAKRSRGGREGAKSGTAR